MTARMTCSISSIVSPSRLSSRRITDDAIGLGRPQPGHHFVEQQQPRPGRERARDLEPLAVGQGQAGGDLRALAEKIELRHDFMRATLRASGSRLACIRAPITTLSSTDSAGNGLTN